MTLQERYNEISESLHNNDPQWILFVKDHREELLNHCKKETYKPGDLYRYRYRPASFVVSKNLPLSSEWILLWLNNIKSRVDFTDISELYIPDVHYLISLHTKYEQLTVSSNES